MMDLRSPTMDLNDDQLTATSDGDSSASLRTASSSESDVLVVPNEVVVMMYVACR